jgi:hypothetical protein
MVASPCDFVPHFFEEDVASFKAGVLGGWLDKNEVTQGSSRVSKLLLKIDRINYSFLAAGLCDEPELAATSSPTGAGHVDSILRKAQFASSTILLLPANIEWQSSMELRKTRRWRILQKTCMKMEQAGSFLNLVEVRG